MNRGKIALAIASLSFSFLAAIPLAHAHSAFDKDARVEKIGNYQMAFEVDPKVPRIGEITTLHVSILNGSSPVNSVYAAMLMKEDDMVVEQIPYRQHEFGDVSVPYKFDEGSADYAVTVLARVPGDSKYQANPLVAEFEIPVGTAVSIQDLVLFQVLPFLAAVAAGMVFLFRRKNSHS